MRTARRTQKTAPMAMPAFAGVERDALAVDAAGVLVDVEVEGAGMG